MHVASVLLVEEDAATAKWLLCPVIVHDAAGVSDLDTERVGAPVCEDS
jgi:hypothetical protein